MKEKIIAKRKLIDILVIILVGLFICVPMLGNLDVYKDDGIQHIARAYGTKESFKNTLFPNIITSFTNGFGYSWNLFYGPSTPYAILLTSFLTGNFINAYKVVTCICLIFSGFTMYKFVNCLTKNNNASLLASILYMTFPYHLTDLYIRNALGEFASFVFIPLVFLGLYNLFYTSEKKNYELTIGAVGLILTHNLSTVIVAFFALLYTVLNIEKLKETRVKKDFIINIVFILILTSFYWIPLIETHFAGRYQVYQDGAMSTKEGFLESRLNFSQLFVTKNDGSFVFELGPHFMLMFAVSLMAFRRMKSDIRELHVFFIVSTILSVWMSTKLFPWGLFPDEVSMVQFAWRYLMMSGFFLSTVCALNMFALIKEFNIKDVLVISIISVMYICAFVGYVTYDDGIQDINNLELGIMSGREREVVAGTAKAEYLPVNAFDNRFYIASREDEVFVLEGKAFIENQEKNGTRLSARVETYDADYTVFELPYIYYPGYKVTIDGSPLALFETENGFLGFAIGPKDDGLLEVSYNGTMAMKISLCISAISLIGFCIYVWKKR